ncbi:MAG: shikimate dehydrogenase, partial [Spirochaetaceae bacterium]|nr:shikimate dehydrogenase [Spirochaetaceae bacterium]
MAKELNFKQELVGLFGKPVAENPTQVMVEAAFRHHHLDWRYLTMEVDPSNLGDAVKGARAMGLRGFNCTIPHKVAVIEHLDGLGESAEVMGAVNCVVNRNGRFIGENTDGKGFVTALENIIDIRDQRIVIFGAGGAARAIGVELAIAGASALTIVNRSAGRGEELATLLNTKTDTDAVFVPWNGDYAVPGNTDVVVNATSVGLYPDVDARPAVDVGSLRPNMVVADVIPNPPETRFIRDAQ